MPQTLQIDPIRSALANRRHEVPDTPFGLYLHVPYCTRRCGYCAFNTYVVADPTAATDAHRQFVHGAVAELTTAAGVLGDEIPALSSIYVGGGTPSLLAPALLGELLDAVRDRFVADERLEVTVEANPESTTSDGLSAWRAAGVTRVSFGVQSAVPRVLDLLDRTHAPEAAVVAVEAARAAGFVHLSVDLIYGTPGESAEDWERSLDLAVSLDTDHVSAYALGIEPGTRLAARVRDGSLPRPSDDLAAARYQRADERLGAAGLAWYEVSNWARSTEAQCRHNLLYWRNHHWWGVGPGAHSHVAGVRWSNEPDPATWAAVASARSVPYVDAEVLDDAARALERVLLGIRTAEGLHVADIDAPHDEEREERVQAVVADGLANLVGDRLVLTPTGRLLADTVVRALTV